MHFWLATDYFSPAADHLPLIHTWSLAVEEQFYLLFPPLLFALWRLARARILPALVALARVSFILMEILRHDNADPVFFLAPTRAWELLAGAILAAAQGRAGPATGAGLHGQLLSAVGLVMICLSFVLYDEFIPDPSYYMLLPVVGTVLVLGWARQGTLAAAILSLAPLTAVGAISYSAYLWHQPILAFARIRLAGDLSTAALLALCLLSLVMAALSWRFVEQPLRRTGPGAPLRLPRFAFAMAAGAALLTLVASIGLSDKVTPYRLPPAAIAQIDAFAHIIRERQAAIRGGKCHFSAGRTEGTVEAFLNRWSCRPQAGEGRIASRVAVFGDSHSADMGSAAGRC